MKFKIDENLPVELAALLNNAGHDAATVAGQKMQGSLDEILVAACLREDRLLVTLDTDFADIRRYPPADFVGFLVLRLARQEKERVLAVFERVVAQLEHDSPQHRLWIIEETRIRIRGEGS